MEARIDARTHARTFFIAFAGVSSCGKTSAAVAVAKALGGIPVISLDQYYLPLDDPKEGPRHNWDHPDAFDWTLVNSHIDAWKCGESVMVPTHDYASYSQIYNHARVDSAPVMIFEGILAFADSQLRSKFDLCVYIECDADVAYGRRLLRDISQRGYSHEEILKRYHEHVKQMAELYIEPTKKYADIIVLNNGTDGLTRDGTITHRGLNHIVQYGMVKL